MNTKFILIVFVIFIFVVPVVSSQKRESKQGIRGIITTRVNQNAADYSCSVVNAAKPVAREIAVYQPLKFSDLKHCDYANPNCSPDVWDAIKGRLVTKIKSDKKGVFRVALPEGKYSLIVKEENGYYVPGNYPKMTNETDAMTVEVVKGKFSETNLEINCSTGEKVYRFGKAVTAQIGESRAENVSQCKLVAVGAKPCGGPTGYAVYSTLQTDENKLLKLVRELNDLSRKYNEEAQVDSTCVITPPPREVYLENGICKTRK